MPRPTITKNVQASGPPWRGALVDKTGVVTLAWMPWLQKVVAASLSVDTATTSLAALQAELASNELDAAALAERVTAVEAAEAASLASLASLQAATAGLTASLNAQTLTLGRYGTRLDADDAAIAALRAAGGVSTHTEILCDSSGPISESSGDFIYVLGVPN